MDLKGVILVHRDFGYCKITAHSGNSVEVHFIGTNRGARYSVQAIAAQKDFKWRAMPVGMKCHVPGRSVCTITEASFGPSETHGLHDYLVAFEGDAVETARLSERELWPIPESLTETPLTRLVGLQADPLAHFRARAGLFSALQQIDRESASVRALASSRITLLPHQAFVIGTVVDDPLWRYILADEVGLGKTIEAGAIAHQLLSENPAARVLILCPGPLARQWLCEMHLSFGGRAFRLLDLHEPAQISLKTWPLVISSLKSASRHHHAQLLTTPWDLVIVDEAHQLLWSEMHYELVMQLANQVPRLLLLSAVPARERETELMRLLRLIDPRQYHEGGAAANRFSLLYSAQAVIGRRLRIVTRQLEKPESLDREQLQDDVERLLSVEILRDDTELQSLQRAAERGADPADMLSNYQELVDQVIARYRLSRRILKNRRSRLVDAELLHGVARTVEVVPYQPSPLEMQINDVAFDLLHSVASKTNMDAFQVLFRKLIQASCDPMALCEISNAFRTADVNAAVDLQMFDANAAFDYDEHYSVLEGLGTLFASEVDEYKHRQFVDLLRAALDVTEQPRMAALISCLESLFAEGTGKILIFAGAFGAAEYLIDVLTERFGAQTVATFRHDLGDDEKEKQVMRFRRDPHCRMLISDESGGEGRNFQFVDELIHFDLPWSVAALEQRIGRLDRIGRERPVRSFVICPSEGLEFAWFRCLAEGFRVFTHSISGLEFMLHATERHAVAVTIDGGPAALIDLIPVIRETSERERATDDAEALTDAASYRRSTRYLQAHENTGDEMLENALPSYLRAISRSDAAKLVTDVKDVSLRIWRLKPEDVSDYKLAGLERQGENPLQDMYGTFSRAIARERPDLDFFGVGHPIVDALMVATREHIRGRSLLARVQIALTEPRLVLLAAWRVHNLADPDTVSERALRLLEGRVVWTGLDLETGELLDAEIAGRLADQLRAENGVAHDLSFEQAVKAFQPASGQWSATLRELLARADDQAVSAYAAKYSEFDATFCEQLVMDAKTVSRTRIEEGGAYEKALVTTADAIRGATLELDVLALLMLEPLSAS